MFILDEPSPQEMEAIYLARADPRISSLHGDLLKVINNALSIWSSDALISDVRFPWVSVLFQRLISV